MATAGDPDSTPTSASTFFSTGTLDSVPFSSGNPRIKQTSGVVLLHPDPSASTAATAASSSNLPVGRKPRVCVLAVPNHMTYADFCRFCGAFVAHMIEMRIVRIDRAEDQYSVLIKFDTLSSTDSFYKHFNGKRFSTLEHDVSVVRFVEDETQLTEHVHSSVTSSAEQPTCPVCREHLDQGPGGILTTICGHSFHCSCISKWTDSCCPVCLYCQQQPEKSMCSICRTSENLWICVVCGNVGCGRYKDGHAIEHWKETEHCYSLELETQKVWDYAGDNYVDYLFQSEADEKLVEYNCYVGRGADSMCSICSGDAGMDEALLNSKVEAIVEEYNDLCMSQLDKQRNYYESLLLEFKEENDEKEVSAATATAVSVKLQKLQTKLDKCIEEKSFLDEINANLLKNQEMWRESIREVQEREQASLRLKDEKINKLEAKLRDLIAHIEGPDALAAAPESISSDIQGGARLPGPSAPSSSSSPACGTRNRKRN